MCAVLLVTHFTLLAIISIAASNYGKGLKQSGEQYISVFQFLWKKHTCSINDGFLQYMVHLNRVLMPG